MKKVNSISEVIIKASNIVCSFLCIALIVLMVGSTFLQIVFRKLFNSPLSWTEEFSRLAFVWINCLGSAIAIHTKSHIHLEYLVENLFSKSFQEILRIVHNAVIVMFFVWVAAPTLQLVKTMNTIPSPSLSLPSGLPHLGFLIGGVAIIFAAIGDSMEAFTELSTRGRE
ncbi:TRAP transporter small permease [Tepidanaerobacter sp. GT38]|uniref:TRAP transporter small permease n=1 Tax=Tepidanaerobacter sp. GT38 TaxID=2722793 RepID=UPI001F234434|nr:TRAP transporter small permease [Tepidanaerobacter sp. GT38]MCG1011522.1 TRAP transporter small permease [Tepidanaerobacter sp. GT38]